MELAVFIALAVVVAAVAVDVLRRRPARHQTDTTQKIIVDLTKRR